jgi:hypothetical protein
MNEMIQYCSCAGAGSFCVRTRLHLDSVGVEMLRWDDQCQLLILNLLFSWLTCLCVPSREECRCRVLKANWMVPLLGRVTRSRKCEMETSVRSRGLAGGPGDLTMRRATRRLRRVIFTGGLWMRGMVMCRLS